MLLSKCYLIQQDISHTLREVFHLRIWKCSLLPAASDKRHLYTLWICPPVVSLLSRINWFLLYSSVPALWLYAIPVAVVAQESSFAAISHACVKVLLHSTSHMDHLSNHSYIVYGFIYLLAL
jgi:hypothetical protein